MALSDPRSRVTSDVFTLVQGDCYFCVEAAKSIIYHECWCTHFTSIRKEFVHVSKKTSNRKWTADTPHHTIGEKRGKRRKGKRAVINMTIKEIWSRRWGSKSRRKKREIISSLIFSLHLPIPSSSIHGYKEKTFLNYQQNWNSGIVAFSLSAQGAF